MALPPLSISFYDEAVLERRVCAWIALVAFVELIPLERCQKNGGTFVPIDGRECAVFRLEDPERVYVTDNACPHAGGNLSGGEVQDLVVTCPWHHWQFDLETGICVHSDHARVQCFAAEIRNGVVWVDLPERHSDADG